ncbi:pentatricopeptide repeat-containing protein At1g03540-like [Coffea arabica]|uniref:Pentatricopeptide repeat-containing protein At1g03540-like n=1 Tax=Coffea arabica TaxID=13443 RepID=A0A6P6S5L2_COFAR|nr:pentatricopeptide repeat-containing protein At1g03540-like [Coffea arabica]
MKQFLQRHYSSFLLPRSPRPTSIPPPATSQIIHLCRSGYLSDAIHLLNCTHSDFSKVSSQPAILYATLIQACTKLSSFSQGLQFHAHVIKSGLETDRFVGNSLLALYFKLCPNFRDTRKVFDGLFYKDVVSWSSIISGYIRMGKPGFSIDLYMEMVGCGVEPNGFTLSAVIKACAELGELRLGKCFHGVVIKCGFQFNHVIASALIDMYGRNYESGDSRKLFDELIEPDAICWTSVISAYTRNDLYEKALGFFYRMHRKGGLFPDGFTFGSLLTALGNLGWLKHSRQVHAKAIAAGFSGNVFIESSLVDTYAKCGLVNESQLVFDRMIEKNAVSWCALLGGYCQKGDFEKVVELFRHMEEVDLYSFGTVLRACAGLAAVRPGKEVHCQYLRRGGWRDVIVESALVDLYAKCGCVDFAFRIFSQMPVRNLITWNSMISGFAQNGRGGEAIKMFNEMIKLGVKPDRISFVSVLFACSHSGLLDQGRQYFVSMKDNYRIKAEISHYSCMVDLLGRAGKIEDAEDLINSSEFRNDSSLWAALLGSCTTGTDPTVAERIAKKMMELKPDYHLSYVLLANVYREIGRWNDALELRRQMQDKKVNKMPGMSWVETNSGISFLSYENPLEMPARDLVEEERGSILSVES